LDSILASGYFVNGRIELSPTKSSLFARFILKARPLTVKGVDFEVSSPLKDQMLNWIRKTGEVIKTGDVYQAKQDDRTTELISFFFRSIGKRVGITRRVDLDYRVGSARLSYRITVGPDMVPIRPLPPFESACKQPIKTFSLTDIDDYVPVNLVEKMTKTHAFGCFDARTVARDQRRLQDSNLFQEARYNVGGSTRDRQISMYVRGKPLKVREVRITGYGLFSDRPFGSEAELPMRPGDTYRRSTAYDSLEYLKNKYVRPGVMVEVVENDELANDGQLVVTFQLLGYEEDTVVINGRKFRVAPPVIRGHS